MKYYSNFMFQQNDQLEKSYRTRSFLNFVATTKDNDLQPFENIQQDYHSSLFAHLKLKLDLVDMSHLILFGHGHVNTYDNRKLHFYFDCIDVIDLECRYKLET